MTKKMPIDKPGERGLRAPPGERLLFDLLYSRFQCQIKGQAARLPRDDQEDVLSKFWLEVWQDVQRGFEYRGEKEAGRWLFTKMAWIRQDYWRQVKKQPEVVSLDAQVSLDDDVVELSEILPAVCNDDPADEDVRDLVIEMAERQLHNDQQVELVRRRMRGQELPQDWSQSWIHTSWHRITKVLLSAFEKDRGNPASGN